MRRPSVVLAVLSVSVLVGFIPAADATPAPARSIVVTGTGVSTYPAFAAGTTRYAATTTAGTGGALTVAATTSDTQGSVLVDGHTATGPVTVDGLTEGDEVSVIISDSAGRTAYSVMYLPAGFPALTATTSQSGVQAGYVGLTLNAFDGTSAPAYDTIVDRNGVPVYAATGTPQNLDLKQQPNGEVTISRPTTAAGRTGTALVTLDDQLREAARQDVAAPLTNTDGHDALKLADGSTILIGYEPDWVRMKTDATIQKVDADGQVTFQWDSRALESESAASSQVQNQNAAFAPGDYAHINSVVAATDGDIIASFRHLSAVIRIATVAHDGYQPGDIIWKLGGRDSSFDFVDDPFGGPCAQHTASVLPNGNIMVFDNGTSGLCVNQSDPTGPTVARAQTRIAEYHLDTTAHTATLVWSYAPPSTYASFAGSARRMDNGDTLIGWADDRDAVATEVTADQQVLWNLVAAAPAPGHKTYMTYRAELITSLTDKIKPTATLAGPTTVRVGDTTAVTPTCTDRGGSTLQTCTTTGLVDGGLDTRTPGIRTVTVTATDGAGNTTTTSRKWTVLGHSVDAAVLSAGSWKGVGIRGTATGQTVRVVTHGRAGRVAGSVLVRNTGTEADTVVVSGSAANRWFDVRYYAGSTDVTKRVTAGTYRTATLAPGASVRIRVVLVRKPAASNGRQVTATLRTTSVGSASAVDRVALVATARR